MESRKYLIISCILFLAFFLRIYRITAAPVGFFTDEAALGYNAYKLLTTGKDDHGKSWPLFFQSFGEYRIPIPIYSNIPSVVLFGLSEFSVRFTTVVYGVATVFMLYLIGKKLGGVGLGLCAALLLAVSPWHIHISRWGSEYASFPFFFSLGLYLFLKSFKNRKMLPVSYLVFGLGLYTYYPAWFIIPVFLGFASLYWLVKERFHHKKNLLLAIVLFLLISLPLLKGLKDGYLLTRWNNIQDSKMAISERVKKTLPLYFDHFGVNFLFLTGDLGYPGHFVTRQFVRGMGVFYLVQLPFFVGGILLMIYAIFTKRKEWLLITIVLLIYPFSGALTLDGPSTTRSVIGVIPITLISALALCRFYKTIYRYILLWLLVGLIIAGYFVNIRSYLFNYYIEYPKYSADFWGWQSGQKETINYMISVEDKYDELFSAGEANGPDVLIPFYTLDNKRGCNKCALGSIDKLDKSKKQLFVASPGMFDDWFTRIQSHPSKIVKEFYYPSGAVSFQAVEY